MRTFLSVVGGIILAALVVILIAFGVYGTARVASRGWHYGLSTTPATTTIKVECATVRPCPDRKQHQPTAKRPATKPTKPAPPKAPVITPKPTQAVVSGDNLTIIATGPPAVIIAQGLAKNKQGEDPCCPVPTPAMETQPHEMRGTMMSSPSPTPQKRQTEVRCPTCCKGGR